ncbi:MAG: chemotaxis protein CheX [Candidatus Gastranaerophilales bacterium]|nr:chemotaxis protein CheX [Candidatus Gastranaerophilales bacterium]
MIDVLFDFAKKSFEDVTFEVTEEKFNQVQAVEENQTNMLSILIGVAGETNGRILLNTSIDNGKNLAKAMNFGEDLENDEDLYVYLAEFANIFCGRTATYMNNKYGKREIWITPPSIFSAKDLDIVTPNVSSQKAFYKSSYGEFTIDVGQSESICDDF